MKPSRCHANHRALAAIDSKGSADDRRVAAQTSQPEVVAHYHDAFGASARFVRIDLSERHRGTKRREVVAERVLGPDAFGPIALIEALGGQNGPRQVLEDASQLAIGFQIAIRNFVRLLHQRAGIPHHDQPLGARDVQGRKR